MNFKNTIELYDKVLEAHINFEETKAKEEEIPMDGATESDNGKELESMLSKLESVYAEEVLKVDERYSALVNELDKRVNEKHEEIPETV